MHPVVGEERRPRSRPGGMGRKTAAEWACWAAGVLKRGCRVGAAAVRLCCGAGCCSCSCVVVLAGLAVPNGRRRRDCCVKRAPFAGLGCRERAGGGGRARVGAARARGQATRTHYRRLRESVSCVGARAAVRLRSRCWSAVEERVWWCSAEHGGAAAGKFWAW